MHSNSTHTSPTTKLPELLAPQSNAIAAFETSAQQSWWIVHFAAANMRVSATLIVRNEFAFIEECLSSLVGFVDQIVLVDTGSRDDTLQKARRYPVELHSFPWCDDFSAARNYAIEKAER